MRAVARARHDSSDRAQRAASAAAAVLAALLASACAANAPQPRIAPEQQGAPGVRSFLLGPANLAIALRPELESGVEPVQHEIARYLRAQGRSVEALPLHEGRERWAAAIDEAKRAAPKLSYAGVAEIFTRRLAETREFQALVLPSLLLDRTTVRHRKATWDGVERRIRVVNVPHRGAGRADNALVDGMSIGSLNASVAVASLHVSVFSEQGRGVFEGRGGLDLLEEVDMKDAARTLHFQLALRGDLLQDRKLLREGVAVAFSPYLPLRGR